MVGVDFVGRGCVQPAKFGCDGEQAPYQWFVAAQFPIPVFPKLRFSVTQDVGGRTAFLAPLRYVSFSLRAVAPRSTTVGQNDDGDRIAMTATGSPAATWRMMAPPQPKISSSGCGASTRTGPVPSTRTAWYGINSLSMLIPAYRRNHASWHGPTGHENKKRRLPYPGLSTRRRTSDCRLVRPSVRQAADRESVAVEIRGRWFDTTAAIGV